MRGGGMKGRPPRPQSHAGLPPLAAGRASGGSGSRRRWGGGCGAASPCGTGLTRASHMRRARVGRGSPALAGGPRGCGGTSRGRESMRCGRKEDRGPPAPLPAPRPGAGKPDSAGGGSQARGGTGVSQPAAAGGREKLGQQQQRKDKMAAAQEEVRSEARAHGRGACAGKAQLPMGSKAAILELGKRPSRRIGAAILEPGAVCEGGRGQGAGGKGQY